jgi:hypothetical protein
LVDGYLSAANFVTFNGKQDALTLTTTGSTGAATLIGATLNIPNYADQFVGTVTSVNMSVPTGFAISGNPITTSGTLAVAFATGYSLPTDAIQANWTAAYNDKINSASFDTSTGVITLTQQDAGTVTVDIDGRFILLSEKGAANGVATLDAGGKLPVSQLPSSVFEYKGTWNAATNTPTLANGTGDPGDVYRCTVAGTVNFGAGAISFEIGDLVIYDGTEWQKSDSTDAVTSVNGYTGTVVLTTSDISEGTNLYFTTARARQSLSAGTAISYDNSTGVITNSAPDQIVAITAGTGTSVTGTYPNFTISATGTGGTVTSVDLTAGTGISVSGGPITTSGSITVTNTAPDQVVSITGAGTTSVTGTYPSFTITSNDQYDGTVTSVDMSVPTGFAISGNPITTSGTLALAFASGYSLPTNASQANWDTAYNNSITAFSYNTSTGVLTLTQQDAGTLTATVTLAPFDTDDLAEGATNKYDKTVALTGAGTTTITGTYPSFTITSNDEFDGTVTSVATTAPITGGTITTTGTIGITQSGAATDGYLSSTDWNTFNSKEPSLTKGNLTEATSSVLTITGGTNAVIGTGTTIQVSQAGASSNGYLSSTDWNTFNGKQNAITLTTTGTSGVATLIGATLNIPDYTEQYSGTVTSVATTAPITGGTITTTGTIGITQAGAASDGYLSSADWTTFNSKQGALTFTAPLVNTSGTITITQSGAATDGYLSSTDWNTFNGKEPALTKGNLTEVTSAVLTITNGTNAVIGSGTSIQVAQSSSTTNGYLSSTDWSTFNGKQDAITLTTTGTSGAATLIGATLNIPDYTEQYTGTVTSVDLTAGTGISVSGGPITTSGSITVTNNDLGSSQNIFKNIAVAGQSTIVADVNDDTLTVVAGSGVTITTNDTTDTITISATGSGGSVTSVGTSAPITGGTITTTGTIGITQSGAAADGYLSSTDWNTFNNKQNALTNPVTGTGTTNYVPKWTSGSAIGDSAIYDNAGNVGIGTTAPNLSGGSSGSTILTVSATSSARNGILELNGTRTTLNDYVAYVRMFNNGAATPVADIAAIRGSSDTTGSLTLSTSNAERLRIDSAGNVGIGTTEPAKKLVVQSSSQTWASAPQIAFYDTETAQTDSRNWTIGAISTNWGSLNIASSTAAGGDPTTPRFTITKDGNVGIGTTAPGARLHVAGSAAVNTREVIADFRNSSDSQRIDIRDENSATLQPPGVYSATAGYGLGLYAGATNAPLILYAGGITNSEERMRILGTNGNVGIGTTSPSQKLEVSGSAAGDFAALSLSNTNQSGTADGLTVNFKLGRTVDSFLFTIPAIKFVKEQQWTSTPATVDGALLFSTILDESVNERMRIASNGVVRLNAYGSGGITGSPAYSLSVDANGDIIESASPLNATSLYDLLPAGRVAYNWVGQVVNDTWTTVFSKSSNLLTTGTWMVKMYVSDFATGGGHYTYTYSGMFTWYQDTTNQGGEQAASEIYLHRMGHAANASVLYLRTTETTASSSGDGFFQIKGNYSNTANQTIQFQFVKIF